jgi:hypothetical protein
VGEVHTSDAARRCIGWRRIIGLCNINESSLKTSVLWSVFIFSVCFSLEGGITEAFDKAGNLEEFVPIAVPVINAAQKHGVCEKVSSFLCQKLGKG